MPSWLYDAGPNSLAVFVIVTVLMGGAAAFVAGRVMAQTWRPLAILLPYMALLAAGVRFIHFAVFGEVLLAPQNYFVDFAVLLIFAVLGFKLMRARQMVEQYGWRE